MDLEDAQQSPDLGEERKNRGKKEREQNRKQVVALPFVGQDTSLLSWQTGSQGLRRFLAELVDHGGA